MTDPALHYADGPVTLWHGDCLEVMAKLPDGSVDAVVTDPPYGLEFMGHDWDAFGKGGGAVIHDPALERGGFQDGNGGNPYSRSRIEYGRQTRGAMHAFQAWCEEWAAEAYRLLKPGGHLLAFGGTRTFHRLAAGIEDAGFEIRDSIAWLYGSGFPKSLDVSKAIDRTLGADRRVVGQGYRVDNHTGAAPYGSGTPEGFYDITAPATPEAAKWDGWGTALKPAFEPVVVARKPLDGTVAANVLAHGTGALNIDGNRLGYVSDADRDQARVPQPKIAREHYTVGGSEGRNGDLFDPAKGRWPANVTVDPEMAAAVDVQSGVTASSAARAVTVRDPGNKVYGRGMGGRTNPGNTHADEGGASRFFHVSYPDPPFRYSAKAAGNERPSADGIAHPTVKPVSLMRWLIRLVTPPGGTVLEPFSGSGSTVEAAVLEGFHVIGIEREQDYLPLILQRIHKPHAVGLDFGDWEP